MEAFPGQGLPGTDLGQLKRRAKDWLRRARSNDAEALVLLRRLHPRGAELAAHPNIVTLADAQLCLARFHGFPSWPTLRAHLQAVEPWKRRPTGSEAGLDDPDTFLRLACLSYSDDDRARVTRAIDLLAREPELSTATIFAAAATGAVEALHELLAADPGAALRDGGPHRWPPLLYLCFGRVRRPARPLDAGIRSAAAGRRRGGERRLPLARAGATVHRVDRGVRGRRESPSTSRRTSTARSSPDCCWRPARTPTTGRHSTTGCSSRLMIIFDCSSSSVWAR